MGMDRLSKALCIALAILIVITGIEAYIIQTHPLVSSTAPVRVACVGDSLTRGTEYTLYLWEDLNSTNYLLSDFGVGGTTVSTASEKPYINQSAYQLAQNFQPNIVIIMLGTNDAGTGINETTDAFVADYITIILAFQALPTKPTIYIVQPPPIYNVTGLSNTLLNNRVLPGIQTVASQTGAILIDANTPLQNKADLFYDGVHPDADGAKKIADIIYAKLSLP